MFKWALLLPSLQLLQGDLPLLGRSEFLLLSPISDSFYLLSLSSDVTTTQAASTSSW